jgi:hypothetical protein
VVLSDHWLRWTDSPCWLYGSEEDDSQQPLGSPRGFSAIHSKDFECLDIDTPKENWHYSLYDCRPMIYRPMLLLLLSPLWGGILHFQRKRLLSSTIAHTFIIYSLFMWGSLRLRCHHHHHHHHHHQPLLSNFFFYSSSYGWGRISGALFGHFT